MTAMPRPRPRFEDRILDWHRAYDVILDEIEHTAPEGPSYPMTERFANRRAAATAAATLMAGGTRQEVTRG